jgi:hypothetical protein
MAYPSSTLLYPGAGTLPGTLPDGGADTPSSAYSSAFSSAFTVPSANPLSFSTAFSPDFAVYYLTTAISERLIQWDSLTDRQIETGLDRGVLYPKNGVAVPWIGLTSVDVTGGDGAAEYYVDGRPFLYLPKPKEFKATLKAYTYPDAFSEIMGEIEVTDGMYLDSQMGDSFGLCYRTRVIDSLRGEDGAYKIHLIYNATVVPSAVTYGTIGSSINPVEFSWPIQAVPIRVTGYRPTAHITIDTRHMDATRLGQIETLLYGTEDYPATLPDAQTIFDLLSFGDAIVITDNGDGTWAAEGSYENIYLIGDDVFQIENVNAVNHGDGTYTISSTP